MRGWLLDTNVVASLMAPNGAPSVKAWGRSIDEERVHLSILTLGEYDKGIAKLPENHSDRQRHVAARDAIEARFAGRILPVGDSIVRRWVSISGKIARETGHPPPVIDTLLAATALEAGLYFVTRNVRDVRMSRAAVFDPWHDDPIDFPLGRPRQPTGV